MKTLSSLVLIIAICAASAGSSAAAGDKTLQNVRGDVSYQQGSGTATSLATNASIALGDNDFAITGDKSLGTISLPDSSRVLVGSNTRLQLAFFNQQPNLATAKFILYKGATRFEVQHPAGAKADYTFQTSTGQIAVRGTEGEIYLSDRQMQVAVYQLTDPSLPVEVTLDDGEKFELHAGQLLTVGIAAGAAVAGGTVGAVDHPLVATSTQEFGNPPSNNVASATEAVAGAAAGGISPALAIGAAAAAAAGIVLAGGKGSISSSSPTAGPYPTPSATPAGPIAAPSSLPPFDRAGETQPLTASEPSYAGTFTASQYNASVVTVTPKTATASSSGATFHVKAVATGQTSITIADSFGQTAVVGVQVTVPVVLPPSLSFDHPNQTMTIEPKESGYGGSFTVVSGYDTSVVTVKPAAGASFTVKAAASGNTSLQVQDDNGTKSNATAIAVRFPVDAPAMLPALAAGGSADTLTPKEENYEGTFRVLPGYDRALIAVSPASGASFQVAPNAAGKSGTTTITVADSFGTRSSGTSVTVKATPLPSPTPTSVPICVSAAGPKRDARDAHASPQTSPAPTCTPSSFAPSIAHPSVTPKPHAPRSAAPPPPNVPGAPHPGPAFSPMPGFQTPPPALDPPS